MKSQDHAPSGLLLAVFEPLPQRRDLRDRGDDMRLLHRSEVCRSRSYSSVSSRKLARARTHTRPSLLPPLLTASRTPGRAHSSTL
jgi:hypothetical protein